MSNCQKILEAFKKNKNKLTLGYVLRYSWGYKFTSRLSDLRYRGYKIDFTRGSKPSKNSWVLLSTGYNSH
jgi:hypothetical protein